MQVSMPPLQKVLLTTELRIIHYIIAAMAQKLALNSIRIGNQAWAHGKDQSTNRMNNVM